jgi:hypothetical protein
MPGTLKLNSGGAGNLILTPSGSVGSDVTLTLPASTATLLTNKTAGTVLQVVNAVDTTLVNSTSTTLADTSLTASITPTSASSKILVMVSTCVAKTTGSTDSGLKLAITRNGSALSSYSVAYGAWTGSSAYARSGYAFNYLDTPATTSALTYKLQFASMVAGVSVAVNHDYSTSTITLIEVAA